MVEANDQVLADHGNGMWLVQLASESIVCGVLCLIVKLCLINSLKTSESISETTKIFVLKNWDWQNEKDLPYSNQPWAGFMTPFIFNEKLLSWFFLFMGAYDVRKDYSLLSKILLSSKNILFFYLLLYYDSFCWNFLFSLSLFTFLISLL